MSKRKEAPEDVSTASGGEPKKRKTDAEEAVDLKATVARLEDRLTKLEQAIESKTNDTVASSSSDRRIDIYYVQPMQCWCPSGKCEACRAEQLEVWFATKYAFYGEPKETREEFQFESLCHKCMLRLIDREPDWTWSLMSEKNRQAYWLHGLIRKDDADAPKDSRIHD
jgi:hypothetical protein